MDKSSALRFAVNRYAIGNSTQTIVQVLMDHESLTNCQAKSVCLTARKRLRKAVVDEYKARRDPNFEYRPCYWEDCEFSEIVRIAGQEPGYAQLATENI